MEILWVLTIPSIFLCGTPHLLWMECWCCFFLYFPVHVGWGLSWSEVCMGLEIVSLQRCWPVLWLKACMEQMCRWSTRKSELLCILHLLYSTAFYQLTVLPCRRTFRHTWHSTFLTATLAHRLSQTFCHCTGVHSRTCYHYKMHRSAPKSVG